MAEERRINPKPTRRKSGADVETGAYGVERRIHDRLAGRSSGHEISSVGASTVGGVMEDRGVVQVKTHIPRQDRRIGGAGRRAGDLARALETGETVTYQAGKGFLKGTGKLAKKAGALGLALTIGSLASEAKAATKGFKVPNTTGYVGAKNILPVKPKVR